MSLQLNGTDGVTFNDGSEQWAAASPIGTKNLIINGDMMIAQRGTIVTGITLFGYFTVDRWKHDNYNAGTWTMSQDTDVPTGQGFANSLKMTCTTAQASLPADARLQQAYRIEGQHLQHLKYGSSNAESLTLSFWVKTNKTGTYVINLQDLNNSKNIGSQYTVSSANTWEKKTLTFSGNTSNNFDNDNNASLVIEFWFGAGSDKTTGTPPTTWTTVDQTTRAGGITVNLADSTSNYANITGVQLEVGDTATPFEHRPYDMELARCQRYYQKMEASTSQYFDSGWVYTSSTFAMIHTWTVPMRIAPTSMDTTGTASDYRVAYAASGTPCTSIPNINQTGASAARIHFPTAAVLTVGHAAAGFTNSSNAYLGFSAEL